MAESKWVIELEKRSMSSWSPEEMKRYNELTGQADNHRTYWIVEWSFKGQNRWQPVNQPPFLSEEGAVGYIKRVGFDYRILTLSVDRVANG